MFLFVLAGERMHRAVIGIGIPRTDGPHSALIPWAGSQKLCYPAPPPRETRGCDSGPLETRYLNLNPDPQTTAGLRLRSGHGGVYIYCAVEFAAPTAI